MTPAKNLHVQKEITPAKAILCLQGQCQHIIL